MITNVFFGVKLQNHISKRATFTKKADKRKVLKKYFFQK
jgi:hypothetical protein